MKPLFIVLLLLAGFRVKSQTVGDHLSYIKEKEEGIFYSIQEDDSPYLYVVYLNELESEIMYFFNKDLICTSENIQPKTPEFAKAWIDSLNLKWKPVSTNKWEYSKENGMVLVCELVIMENRHFSFDNDQYEFYIREKNPKQVYDR